MSAPILVQTVLAEGPGDGEVLVVGPSLGTSVEALWGPCADLLGKHFRVVGWDLPGHGRSPRHNEAFTVAELAQTLLDAWPEGHVRYAGVSVGGSTGLELALLNSSVAHVAVLCSGAAIGTRQAWRERAELVRQKGTDVMVDGSRQRWFAPESLERRPDTCDALLKSLQDTDSESYARVCEALGEYDVRARLGEITVPVLAIAGEADEVCPPAFAREVADGVRSGQAVVVAGAAHLAPAEQPQAVADLLLHNESANPTIRGDHR
jgi:3-oxoadipate enol-lactonase